MHDTCIRLDSKAGDAKQAQRIRSKFMGNPMEEGIPLPPIQKVPTPAVPYALPPLPSRISARKSGGARH